LTDVVEHKFSDGQSGAVLTLIPECQRSYFGANLLLTSVIGGRHFWWVCDFVACLKSAFTIASYQVTRKVIPIAGKERVCLSEFAESLEI